MSLYALVFLGATPFGSLIVSSMIEYSGNNAKETLLSVTQLSLKSMSHFPKILLIIWVVEYPFTKGSILTSPAYSFPITSSTL